jgi:hypothetical protein
MAVRRDSEEDTMAMNAGRNYSSAAAGEETTEPNEESTRME